MPLKIAWRALDCRPLFCIVIIPIAMGIFDGLSPQNKTSNLPKLKPLVNLFYTLEFVYNRFISNVNSPITLHFVRSGGIYHMHFNSLILLIRQ